MKTSQDTRSKSQAPIRIHKKGLSQDRLERLMKRKDEKKALKKSKDNKLGSKCTNANTTI